MLSFEPSRIATASVYLTCKMLKVAPAYTMLMKNHIGYTEQQVRECVRELCVILNDVDDHYGPYERIYRKYLKSELHSVALVPELIKKKNN